MLRILALGCALLLAGCGPKVQPLPPSVPVAGKLTNSAGKPLTNVVVTLHPAAEGSTEGTIPTAAVDATGAFTLKARPGKYKVTVAKIPGGTGTAAAPVLNPGADGPLGKMNRVPIYNDFKSTPLEVTVPEGGKSDIVFKVDL
jgi:hypothetical protein